MIFILRGFMFVVRICLTIFKCVIEGITSIGIASYAVTEGAKKAKEEKE